MSNGPTLKMKKRLNYFVVIAFILAFAVLIGSLVNIGIIKHQFYMDFADKQQLRPETVKANRGTIYDRNMSVLAQSATVWDISISPVNINEKDKEAVATLLAELLQVDKTAVIEKTKRKTQYEIIKKKVEKEVADNLRKVIAEKNWTNYIYLMENTKRYYPNSELAASVVGFTGTDSQGLYGLELTYDKVLSGTPGYVVSLKDGVGRNMPNGLEKKYDPIDGNNVVTTIDETIQHFLEKSLDRLMLQYEPKMGCAGIVMNVNTGDILAMANRPTFDLNSPFLVYNEKLREEINALSDDDRKKALAKAQQDQWNNKAISYAYQPGSTFKTIVASSALEEKTSSLNSHFYCNGKIIVADRTMKCHKTSGHGALDFTGALVNSCNPSFVAIGQSLGAENFFKYFEAFGLTRKTGIDLPGEGSSQYYTAKDLGEVSLASCSFGQSMALTPIQLITAVSAVTNGGYLVTPRVVKDIVDSKGNIVETKPVEVKRQVISEETSRTVAQLMKAVVEIKGGSNAYLKGYSIGGKSGTSQKQNPGDSPDARISSYVAVAPVEKPEIAVMIMVDEPNAEGTAYGSVIAAPEIRLVLADTLPYLGYSPQYSAEDLAKTEATMPNLVSLGISDAAGKLASIGLKTPVIIGKGTKIMKQVPSPSSKIPKDGTIYLYTENAEEQMVKVPNVLGLSPQQAKNVLEKLNLNVVIKGAAIDHPNSKITTQSVAEGQEIPVGTVIEITSVKSDTD